MMRVEEGPSAPEDVMTDEHLRRQVKRRLLHYGDSLRTDTMAELAAQDVIRLVAEQAAGKPVTVPEGVYTVHTAPEARKDDQEKPRHDLIPPEALEALAAVLGHGARKYGDRNWELGLQWSRPYAAAQRHLWAWWAREDQDPETGLSHLAHALCNIAFLIHHERHHIERDDRPPAVVPTKGADELSTPLLGISVSELLRRVAHEYLANDRPRTKEGGD